MAIDNYLEKGKKFLAEKKYQEAIACVKITNIRLKNMLKFEDICQNYPLPF
jgi:hypothetical protein